ncbi:MAG: hypothetical protein AAGK32_16130, partial [Actinomycetota bacterium]
MTVDPNAGFWTFPDDGSEAITTIAATQDPELRAHLVAAAYSEMARCITALMHHELPVVSKGPRDGSKALRPRSEDDCEHFGLTGQSANWFHIATWATTTLLTSIGTEKPPRRIASLGAFRRAATPVVIQARAAGDQYIGRWLAYRQLSVFVSTMRPAMVLLELMTTGVAARRKAPSEAIR